VPVAIVGRGARSVMVEDLVEVRRHHKIVVVSKTISLATNLTVCHASAREFFSVGHLLK
jgi:hypothetical protein